MSDRERETGRGGVKERIEKERGQREESKIETKSYLK